MIRSECPTGEDAVDLQVCQLLYFERGRKAGMRIMGTRSRGNREG